MFARLLKSLGFRGDNTLEKNLAQYDRLNREQKDSVLNAYTKEDVGDVLPNEHLSQTALRLWKAGQRQQALQFYNKAVALAPDDAVLLLNRANLQVEMGNIPEALQDFERARLGKPRLPDYVFANQTVIQTMSPQALEIFVKKRKDGTRT